MMIIEVRQEERKRAFKLIRPERQTIVDAVAFGRRELGEKKMAQDTQRGTETALKHYLHK